MTKLINFDHMVCFFQFFPGRVARDKILIKFLTTWFDFSNFSWEGSTWQKNNFVPRDFFKYLIFSPGHVEKFILYFRRFIRKIKNLICNFRRPSVSSTASAKPSLPLWPPHHPTPPSLLPPPSNLPPSFAFLCEEET